MHIKVSTKSGNVSYVFHIEDVLNHAFHFNLFLQNLWAHIFGEHVWIELRLSSY